MPQTARSVLAVALVGAVVTFVCGLAAASVGLQSGTSTGLTARTMLVLGALLGVALISLARWTQAARDLGPEPLVLGLVLAWALNPLSWIGRSYVGQWWFPEGGLLAATLDLVGWAVSAVLVTYLAHRWVDPGARRGPGGRMR